MAVSKPIYKFIGWYFENLFNRPLRTKAITSCVIATSANLVSQKIGGQEIDTKNLLAYSFYGLIFGGSLPHFFYTFIERALDEEMKFRRLIQFALERLIFAPMFQGVSLYTLARFEGKDHDAATKNLQKLYIPMLIANWKYITFFTFLNFTVVPPMLRVLFANVIGFWWIVFLANKRRQLSKKAD